MIKKSILLSILISLSILKASAQVPNYSFEIWDSTGGYLMPVGWDNMNPYTHTTPINTCERISPGYSGSYFLALNTEDVPGLGLTSGKAVCGKLDPVTHLPVSGFPYTSRPQVLSGRWQYMPYTTADQGHADVLLSKWNTTTLSRDTIGFTTYNLPDMVMAWTQFQIGINYISSDIPDSAMIYFSASGNTPVAYSFFWLDHIELRDSIPPTTGIVREMEATSTISLYPNPARDEISVVYTCSSAKTRDLYISDITGRTVYTTSHNFVAGNNELLLNTSLLTRGLYFVTIDDGTILLPAKLIIN